MLEHYLSLATKAIFVENMALAFFLGMCSFLAVSRRVETAMGLGLAVVFVLGLTCPLNQLLATHLLEAGALAWIPGGEDVDLSFLTYLVLIGTIAATVQVVEMVIDRYVPTLYGSLGVFLPLIAVNCAILGGDRLRARRRCGLRAGDRGAGGGARAAELQQRSSRAAGTRHHLHHGGPDVDGLHGLLGDSAVMPRRPPRGTA
jgi:Na+-transporting NADH:ubiquinone oxidoreductase subunit E